MLPKVPWHHSIRIQLLVLNTLLMAFLGLLSLFLGFIQLRTSHEESIYQQLSSSALVRLQGAQHWLFNQGQKLGTLAHIVKDSKIPSPDTLATLTQWSDTTFQYQSLFILDEKGLVVLSTDPRRLGQDFGHRRLHEVGQVTRVTEGIVFDEGDPRPRLFVGQPIPFSEHRKGWVVAAELDLRELNAILTMRWGTGGRERAFVIAPGPVWVGTLQPEYDLAQAPFPETLNLALSGQAGRGQYTNYQGDFVYGVYRWEDEFSIAIFVESLYEDRHFPVDTLLFMMVFIFLFMGLPVTAMMVLLSRTVVKPLGSLIDAALEFEGGGTPFLLDVRHKNEIGYLSGVFNRIMTTMHGLMEDLTTKEKYYRGLLERSGDYLLVLSPQGNVKYATGDTVDTFFDQLNYHDNKDAVPLDSLIVTLDHDLPDLMKKMKERDFDSLPHRMWIMTRHGEKLLLECAFRELPETELDGVGDIVFRAKDVTDRFYLEQRLRTREKMDSLGIFSAGVAHDFNNLLTAVLGNLSMAKLDLAQGHVDEKLLDKSLEQVERVKELTDRLITVSMGGVFHKTPVHVNALIKELLQPLESEPGLVIYQNLDSSLPPIMADEKKIRDLLAEVLDNSLHFMKRQGSLGIKTDLIYRSSEADNGVTRPHIRLTIQDTGPGIALDQLSKVFEPYYTTRSGAKGLGLSMVYAIMEMHKGYVEVSSAPGKGTEVVLVFPVLELAP